MTSYLYDGGGRRLSKEYSPNYQNGAPVGNERWVDYVFDGLEPVAEYDTVTGQHTNYYRGDQGRLVSMHNFPAGTQGQQYWYHHNARGDVVGMTKHLGQSHHNYRYDPYGQNLPENGNFTDPHNHYTQSGKEFDEHTGLVWYGARHLDPENGVWMTEDSYRGTLEKPETQHRSLYLGSDPVNYLDRFGFEAEPVWNPAYTFDDLVEWGTRAFTDYNQEIALALEGSVLLGEPETSVPPGTHDPTDEHLSACVPTGLNQSPVDYVVSESANNYGPIKAEKKWFGRFVEGALQGEFVEEKTGAHLLGQFVSGLVVLGDIRDLAHDLPGCIRGEGTCGNAVLDVVGFVPLAGDAIKGLKTGIRVGKLGAESGQAATRAVENVVDSASLVGSKRLQLTNSPLQPLRNSDTLINGRTFSGHALDQMQNRGIYPTVVENVINTGTKSLDPIPGRLRHYDEVNNITVVTEGNRIITVFPGAR